MIRSGKSRLLVAAVLVGMLAALVPATPAVAAVAASPLPGTGPGMAYDAADGQVVLFGGSAGRTWTWDGSSWTRRTPAHSPPPSGSYFYGLAYDAADGEVVAFGGTAGETWTWDGTDWTKRTPAHSPSPRQDMGMASDDASGEVVLFGGFNSTRGYLGSTWTWDGTDWTHRTPAHSPRPRVLPGMAYDTARSEVVLFGGEASDGNALFLGDTWTWDGMDWTKHTPAHSPKGRQGAGMADDIAHGKVVLFGGRRFGDTWTWDGTDWTKHTPAHSPYLRLDMGMAYDAASGEVVLFGGECAIACADTWTWDGTDWTQRPAGTISVSQKSGPPGVNILVQGWSFAVLENVKLYFVDSSQGTTYLTEIQAGPYGGFGAVITIPNTATQGAQRVKAKGLTSGRIATVPFTVT
jgi:hypothetical protein